MKPLVNDMNARTETVPTSARSDVLLQRVLTVTLLALAALLLGAAFVLYV